MKKEMLINVLQPEECRIAILEDGVLEELYVERTSHESYVGNIYKGRIVNIEPSIQAAFVDFGVGRNGFLHVSDVEPAYYRHLERRPRRPRPGDRGDRAAIGGRAAAATAIATETRPRRPPARGAAMPTMNRESRRRAASRRPSDAAGAGCAGRSARTPADELPEVAGRRRREETARAAAVEEAEPPDDRRARRRPRRPVDRRRWRRRTRRRGRRRPSAAVRAAAARAASDRRRGTGGEAKPRRGRRSRSLRRDAGPRPPSRSSWTPPSAAPTERRADRTRRDPLLDAGSPTTTCCSSRVREPEPAPAAGPEPLPRAGRRRTRSRGSRSRGGPPLAEQPTAPRRRGRAAESCAATSRTTWQPTSPPPRSRTSRRRVRADVRRRDVEAEFDDETGDPQVSPHEPRPSAASRERRPARWPRSRRDRTVAGDRDRRPGAAGGDDRGGRGRGRMGGRPGMGRPKPLIQDIFKRGQEVLVQVIKEGIGTKGPTLSTYISIAGRYLVLMPGLNRVGVSRKIDDDEQRRRLREIFNELKPPQGLGFIIRTAGMDKNKKELQRDLAYLSRLWQVVVRRIQQAEVAGRDLPGKRHDHADHPRHLHQRHRHHLGRRADRLRARPGVPADRHAALRQPHQALRRHRAAVPQVRHRGRDRPHPAAARAAAHGGSIVIDQTEALVAIDVNSGNFRADNNAEETAYQMNLQAAKEIARQLRLRDLGGVIVNDFIDMRDEKHRRGVEKALRDAVQARPGPHQDPARSRSSA